MMPLGQIHDGPLGVKTDSSPMSWWRYREVYYGMPKGVYHREMAGILGSTVLGLPTWLHDFWLGIGFHQIHHLNARVPCYKLRPCHEEAPEG